MAEEDPFRKLFTGGSIVFVGEMFGLGLSFLSTLVIGRLLGPGGYGAIALGSAALATVSTLVLLGMHTGVGRFLPRYDDPERRRGVLVSAFQLVLPLSILSGAGLILLAEPIATRAFGDPNVAPVLRVFGLAMPFASVEKLAVGGIQGVKRTFPKVLVENVTAHLTRLVLAVVLLWAGFDAAGVAWAYVLGHAGAAGLGTYYLYRYTPLFSRIGATSMHRELLAFSAPLIVSAIMVKILADIDTFLLGYFVSTADVGVYNVLYPLATMLTIVLASFGFLFVPVLSELHAEGDVGEMAHMYRLVTKWIFVASLPIFLVIGLFSELLIRYTYGSQYTEGALALSVLAVGFFVHAIVGPNYKTLTAMGHTRLIMFDNIGAAGLNVALNVLLIPRYSYLGAAVATVIAYFSLNVAYSTQLYTRTGIHPFDESLSKAAIAALVPIGAIYLVTASLVTITLPVSLVLFGLFLAIHAVVTLRFGGIDREEVLLVLDLEDRLGVDLGPAKAVAKRLL
ncbi:flippase [Halalkalicoccus jeotgali]|uniref:Polysaccharide biosynthesis protein n=1 Tax=Halalkalicoccus jeotgali (strain DSM 18796 / CECT 7217 / JCM 14584 / KCTC 4019 / B3) TaxID=795797 RepID=D8J598_HALJB|nr:flippase [Halalkalicoccus jeotgali]ADJ13679.1 polysaccharide biosynthesis protein [Halalkalicoccus jeotgali B3]ELY34274.1 polysaccharide biosynthesis protein [Halalkalicoccus jeotgali B3]